MKILKHAWFLFCLFSYAIYKICKENWKIIMIYALSLCIIYNAKNRKKEYIKCYEAGFVDGHAIAAEVLNKIVSKDTTMIDIELYYKVSLNKFLEKN